MAVAQHLPQGRHQAGDRHLKFHEHRDNLLGLVGESGCGKSTLARTIVGLLPLQSGRISVDGLQWDPADRGQRAQLRRTVQMVFQDPYMSLNPRPGACTGSPA